MKILIYFPGKLFEPRGTPIRTCNILRQLIEQGFEVYYAGQDHPEGFDTAHILPLARPLARPLQLIRFVRRNHIDVVYFQAVGLPYAVPLRFFTHARLGLDFHTRLYQELGVYHHYGTGGIALLEHLERFQARFLHFATAVSHTLAGYYGSAVPHILTLPVGVDTRLFAPGTPPESAIAIWKGESALLAYAGNTKWYQGIETVLEAFRVASQAHPGALKFLVVASSGSSGVRTYVEKHGLSGYVKVLDKQPHEKIPSLLAAADILTVVRPSDLVTEYSFPSKLPEYAALGKALVVSRVSDIESYIKNGENGLVVAPDDIAATARALEALLDPALRQKLGIHARELAEREFALEKLGVRLADFLRGLVE